VTPLRLASMALLAGATAAAVALARKNKLNRPIAWYLVGIVALDLVRLGVSQLLPTTPPSAPVVGSVLFARHVDVAAYLGQIMLLPAMTMALFLRKRPWIIGVVYLAIAVVLIASYPSIRGNELLEIYTGIELASVVASFGFWIMWLCSPRLTEDRAVSVHITSGVVLTSTNMATVVLPPLTGPGILAKWPIFVALHASSFAFVLVFQLRYLLMKTGKGKL